MKTVAVLSNKSSSRLLILAMIALANACLVYSVTATFSVFNWWQPRYFPASDPRDIGSLVGYITRYVALPFGLVLIGIRSDRTGRRAGLETSLIFTGTSALVIAVLPDAKAIGALAGIIVVIALLMQAMATSAVAAAFLLEIAPARRHGFFVAWKSAGGFIASLLVTATLALFLPVNRYIDFSTDASRIPLLLGATALPLGILLRFLIPEAEPFLQRQNKPNGWTILYAILADWRTIGTCALLAALYPTLGGLTFFLTAASRKTLESGLPAHFIDFMRCIAAVVMVVAGWQCDRIGKRRLLVAVALLSLLTVAPAISYAQSHPSVETYVSICGWFTLLLGVYFGVLFVTLAELLPIEIRVTGLILAFDVIGSTFGNVDGFVFAALREPGTAGFTEGGAMLLLFGWVTICSLACLVAAFKIRDGDVISTQMPRRDTTAASTPHFHPAPAAADDPNWREALLNSLAETGVQHPIHSRHLASRIGVVAYLIGLGLVAISLIAVVVFVGRIAIPGMFGSDPQSEFFASILWIAFSVMVLSRPTVALIRRMWRAGARSAEAELQRDGSRRPILYLRSFDLDEKIARISILEILTGRAFSNAEEALVDRLRRYGPVIAIGRPEEKLPTSGAARFYVSHERWKEKVADVTQASQFVVWATGTTEGLRWEISHLLETVPPQRLILWAHPHLLGLLPPDREVEWRRFVTALGSMFPRPLPAYLGITRFFHFDSDYYPIAATSLRSVLAPPRRSQP